MTIKKSYSSKKSCKNFQIRSLREYTDLYVQSDTLLLADVFNIFWNICFEINGLDPAHFLFAPGLA